MKDEFYYERKFSPTIEEERNLNIRIKTAQLEELKTDSYPKGSTYCVNDYPICKHCERTIYNSRHSICPGCGNKW